VPGNFLSWLLLANIPHAQLLVSAGGDKLGAIGAPGEGLDDIVVLESELGLASFNVPELHRVVTRGTGENALGSGVEQDVADFPAGALAACCAGNQTSLPHMPAQSCYGRDVGGLLAITLQSEVLWDLPNEDLRFVSLVLGIVCSRAAPCRRLRRTRSTGR
jgi:hypothetical protein